jgi:hypothetical protein
MHSYYHLGPLVLSYFFVGYLSDLSRTILARFSHREIEVEFSFYKL